MARVAGIAEALGQTGKEGLELEFGSEMADFSGVIAAINEIVEPKRQGAVEFHGRKGMAKPTDSLVLDDVLAEFPLDGAGFRGIDDRVEGTIRLDEFGRRLFPDSRDAREIVA